MAINKEKEKEAVIAKLEKSALEHPDNYAKIQFGYSKSFVMPYADALALMKCLISAECYDNESYGSHLIRPIGKDDSPTMEIISRKMYIDLKMSHILKTQVEGV